MNDTPAIPDSLRRLCLVCGDQLDRDSALFDGFDPKRDAILMTEAVEEASYVPQHKKRLVLFFSAMRHFAAEQAEAGRPVLYHRLDAPDVPESLQAALTRAATAYRPAEIRVVQPGDYRVLVNLRAAAEAANVPFKVLEDRHFLTQPEEFETLRSGRKRFILEDFYRAQRKRTGWLMDASGAPVGGAWNFDKDNRKSFGARGPGLIPPRVSFPPDQITQGVIRMVAARFAAAPGKLDGFDEPVTANDAQRALADFISNRLIHFGDYQDAMAAGHLTLHHSRLSAVMNLKLLSPKQACEAALSALAEGRAPINAVEGFIRQILGWREFVRGVYWTLMPEYAARNHLGAELEVPGFFWTGETDMACLADGLGGLVETGYAHHIQRLMVMGLYLMLYGADPYKTHQWHIAMYLDAVDWVSLPNMLGMSQHADGGVVGTKPYTASGAYIDRMSDYCGRCRFNPKQASGEQACPVTVLYWDFLARHQDSFRKNQRMAMQLRNLDRKDAGDLFEIRRNADQIRGAC